MLAATEAFLRHLERERNASPHTIRAYGEDLRQFTAYLEAVLGREPRPEDADRVLIRGFLAELHRRGLKKSSSARRLAGLRTFFRFLCREGRLDRNPARALLSPRLEKRIPAPLDEATVEQVDILTIRGSKNETLPGDAIEVTPICRLGYRGRTQRRYASLPRVTTSGLTAMQPPSGPRCATSQHPCRCP